MENTVAFREFEERDIDFIYKWKNDEGLNSMIVGQWHPFTREEAEKWVHGCMGEHETYKFWAICSNDKDNKIVGWASLSNIDRENRSVCHHGIFIGDNYYKDGSAMFEAMLFTMDYAFTDLHAHRLYGSCLSAHKISPHMLNSLGFTLEGIRREAVIKRERFCDVLDYAILEDEYRVKARKGEYDINCLIINFIKNIKGIK